MPRSASLITAFLWLGLGDPIVGLAITAINADAAHEVWEAAHEEGKAG